MNIDHYEIINKDRCIGAPFFVVATDKLFCDCPLWPGKIAKIVIACDTYEQAERVEDGLKFKRGNRGDFSYVKIIRTLPVYANRKYAVKVMHYNQATAFH